MGSGMRTTTPCITRRERKALGAHGAGPSRAARCVRVTDAGFGDGCMVICTRIERNGEWTKGRMESQASKSQPQPTIECRFTCVRARIRVCMYLPMSPPYSRLRLRLSLSPLSLSYSRLRLHLLKAFTTSSYPHSHKVSLRVISWLHRLTHLQCSLNTRCHIICFAGVYTSLLP